MRYLVLSLILLNLGWLAWYFWINEPPTANVVEEQSAPKLTLARESEQEPALPELEATEDERVASVDLDTGAVTVPPESEPAPEQGEDQSPLNEEEPAPGAISEALEGLVAEFETEPARIEEVPVTESAVGTVVEQPDAGEVVPEPEVVAAVTQEVEEAALVPARCVTMGPFSEERSAQGAIAKLDDLGYSATRRGQNTSVKSGTSVYLTGYATRSEASEVVSSLKQQGVRDVMLMPGGATPLISLGFFRNPKLAEQRRNEIRRRGHQAELQERFRESTVYWADFEIPADLEFSTADYGKDLELNDCP